MRDSFAFLALLGIVTAICPNGWRETPSKQDYCIKAFSVKADYFQAEDSCVHNGGHLVSIHSGFENSFVNTVAHEVNAQCQYWIGANRFGAMRSRKFIKLRSSRMMTSDQDWSWMDGTAFSYTKWVKGYPLSSAGTSDCALTDVGTSQWSNSEQCFAKHCYVCGINTAAPTIPPPATPSYTSQPCPNPTYNPYTNNPSYGPWSPYPTYNPYTNNPSYGPNPTYNPYTNNPSYGPNPTYNPYTNNPSYGPNPTYNPYTNNPSYGPNPTYNPYTNNPSYGPNPTYNPYTNNPSYGPNPTYIPYTNNPSYGPWTNNPSYGPWTNNPSYGPNPTYKPYTNNPSYGPNPTYNPYTNNPSYGPWTNNPSYGPWTKNPSYGSSYQPWTMNPC